eukprot:9665110-Heterocapsa_arctica.AAC.1
MVGISGSVGFDPSRVGAHGGGQEECRGLEAGGLPRVSDELRLSSDPELVRLLALPVVGEVRARLAR